jgi:hypothetical protein
MDVNFLYRVVKTQASLVNFFRKVVHERVSTAAFFETLATSIQKFYRPHVSASMPRPRKLRDNPSRNVSAMSNFARRYADFSRFGLERFALRTRSDFQNPFAEALGRPVGRSLATRPEAHAELLG